MVTELFPLKLAFRGLSDEEGDEVETNSPDTDLDDAGEDEDDLPGAADSDDADDGAIE